MPPPPRANLPPHVSAGELQRCRFHPEQQPLCPILRLGDVARFAGQDFAALAATVSIKDVGCRDGECGDNRVGDVVTGGLGPGRPGMWCA